MSQSSQTISAVTAPRISPEHLEEIHKAEMVWHKDGKFSTYQTNGYGVIKKAIDSALTAECVSENRVIDESNSQLLKILTQYYTENEYLQPGSDSLSKDLILLINNCLKDLRKTVDKWSKDTLSELVEKINAAETDDKEQAAWNEFYNASKAMADIGVVQIETFKCLDRLKWSGKDANRLHKVQNNLDRLKNVIKRDYHTNIISISDKVSNTRKKLVEDYEQKVDKKWGEQENKGYIQQLRNQLKQSTGYDIDQDIKILNATETISDQKCIDAVMKQIQNNSTQQDQIMSMLKWDITNGCHIIKALETPNGLNRVSTKIKEALYQAILVTLTEATTDTINTTLAPVLKNMGNLAKAQPPVSLIVNEASQQWISNLSHESLNTLKDIGCQLILPAKPFSGIKANSETTDFLTKWTIENIAKLGKYDELEEIFSDKTYSEYAITCVINQYDEKTYKDGIKLDKLHAFVRKVMDNPVSIAALKEYLKKNGNKIVEGFVKDEEAKRAQLAVKNPVVNNNGQTRKVTTTDVQKVSDRNKNGILKTIYEKMSKIATEASQAESSKQEKTALLKQYEYKVYQDYIKAYALLGVLTDTRAKVKIMANTNTNEVINELKKLAGITENATLDVSINEENIKKIQNILDSKLVADLAKWELHADPTEVCKFKSDVKQMNMHANTGNGLVLDGQTTGYTRQTERQMNRYGGTIESKNQTLQEYTFGNSKRLNWFMEEKKPGAAEQNIINASKGTIEKKLQKIIPNNKVSETVSLSVCK